MPQVTLAQIQWPTYLINSWAKLRAKGGRKEGWMGWMDSPANCEIFRTHQNLRGGQKWSFRFGNPSSIPPWILPMLKHGRGTVHNVRQRGHNEPPSGNKLQGRREAWRQSKLNVLDENLFEDLNETIDKKISNIGFVMMGDDDDDDWQDGQCWFDWRGLRKQEKRTHGRTSFQAHISVCRSVQTFLFFFLILIMRDFRSDNITWLNASSAQPDWYALILDTRSRWGFFRLFVSANKIGYSVWQEK